MIDKPHRVFRYRYIGDPAFKGDDRVGCVELLCGRGKVVASVRFSGGFVYEPVKDWALRNIGRLVGPGYLLGISDTNEFIAINNTGVFYDANDEKVAVKL